MNIPRHKYNPIDTSIVQRMRKLRPAKSTVELITNTIKQETGVDPMAHRNYRGQSLVTARFLFIVFMVKYTKETYVTIASRLGKDHATINHAVKTVQNLCDTDIAYRETYNRIEYKIKSNLQ